MGFYVHWQMSWGGGTPEEVIPIAQKHRASIDFEKVKEGDQLAIIFDDIISGKAHFGGYKGEFWGVGTIGNYITPEAWLEALTPFFQDLFDADILMDHDRVLIFCEPEQQESVAFWQLSCPERGKPITVEQFSSEGKWYWGQY